MPFRSYFLCATPRSGSTLLCDVLTETGVAGRPASYFRKEDVPLWSQRLGVPLQADPFDYGAAYLEAVVGHGSAGTDLFGCRIMWGSLGELSARLGPLGDGLEGDAARIERAFGPTLYMHLSRADKLAQAISLVKALQTGLWHMNGDGSMREGVAAPRRASYDASLIAEHLEAMRRDDAAWHAWFAENRIAPLRLTYETLIADPRHAVADILSALGLDRSLASKVAPRTAKLADDESEDWARRFRAQAGRGGPIA